MYSILVDVYNQIRIDNAVQLVECLQTANSNNARTHPREPSLQELTFRKFHEHLHVLLAAEFRSHVEGHIAISVDLVRIGASGEGGKKVREQEGEDEDNCLPIYISTSSHLT